MSPGTSTTQGRRPRPGALARRRAARYLADMPGRRHARITARPATRIPARTRPARGRVIRRNRRASGRGTLRNPRARGWGTRRNRHGPCQVPAPRRPAPAARWAPAVTGRGSDPPVPHPRFRAALRRRGGGARPRGPVPAPGQRPGRCRPRRRSRCATSIRAGLARPGRCGGPPGATALTRQGRCGGAPGATGLARPAQAAGLTFRLAGPVRPGAGGDAGRVPPATAAGAVDNRAGPRPHPAARAPAVGRAAAAGPAGGDLPAHR